MANNVSLKVLFFLFGLVEINSDSCNFNVVLSQTLYNEGFHRNLTFEMEFVEKSLLYDGCKIGIDQELPAGVFSNPDQLEELRRSQKLNAKPKNRVNIELSTEQSTTVSVYLITDVKRGQASTWIPVHARYHQAEAGGGMCEFSDAECTCCKYRNARNRIAKPKLFLSCPNDLLNSCENKYLKASEACDGSKESCQWRVLPFHLISNPVIWDVPIGNTDHYYLVAMGTVLVIVLGSLHVFKNLHEFKVRINVKKKG